MRPLCISLRPGPNQSLTRRALLGKAGQLLSWERTDFFEQLKCLHCLQCQKFLYVPMFSSQLEPV